MKELTRKDQYEYLYFCKRVKDLSHQSCVLTETVQRPGKMQNAMVRALVSPGGVAQPDRVSDKGIQVE